MDDEQQVIVTIAGDELLVERLRSELVSCARYRGSEASAEDVVRRCRPDLVVWRAGDERASAVGRRASGGRWTAVSLSGHEDEMAPAGIEVGGPAATASARPSLGLLVRAVCARPARDDELRIGVVEPEQPPATQEETTETARGATGGPRRAADEVAAVDVAARLRVLLEARAERRSLGA